MKSERTIIDSIPLLVQKRFVSAKLNSFKEIQMQNFKNSFEPELNQ